MDNTDKYAAPTTKYYVEGFNQRDSINLVGYKTDGAVTSSTSSIKAEDCIFGGTCSGRDGVRLKHSHSGAATSAVGRVSLEDRCKIMGEVSGRDGVTVDASYVTQSITSSVGGVAICGLSTIGGGVSGRDGVKIESSQVTDGVASSTGSVKIKDNSAIGTFVSGRDGVDITDGTVGGDVESSVGRVSLTNSSVGRSVNGRDGVVVVNSRVGGAVGAAVGTVRLDGSTVAAGISGRDGVSLRNSQAVGSVTSKQGRITWLQSPDSPAKAPQIEGRDGVELSWVSAQTVESSLGSVKVLGGAFDSIRSSGDTTLSQASVQTLTVFCSSNRPVTINLEGTIIAGGLLLKFRESTAQTTVSMCDSQGYGTCSVMINGSSLACSGGSFVISGELEAFFYPKLRQFCADGAMGLWNAKPAVYAKNRVELVQMPQAAATQATEGSSEKKALTTVTIVGGAIPGDIKLDSRVKVDLQQTEFAGQITTL